MKTLGLVYHNAALVTFSQEIPLTVKTAENILGLISIILEYLNMLSALNVILYIAMMNVLTLDLMELSAQNSAAISNIHVTLIFQEETLAMQSY